MNMNRCGFKTFLWCAVQDSKEVLYIHFPFVISVLLDIAQFFSLCISYHSVIFVLFCLFVEQTWNKKRPKLLPFFVSETGHKLVVIRALPAVPIIGAQF